MLVSGDEAGSGRATAAELADQLAESFKAAAGNFREESLERLELLGDSSGLLRRFTWDPQDGIPHTSIQLYAVFNGRAYIATANAPSAEFHKYEPAFGKILTSISLAR